MNIFIGHIDIAGTPQALKKGFVEIGESAEVVLSYSNPFEYGCNINPSFVPRFWEWLGNLRGRITWRWFPLKLMVALLHFFWSWLVLVWAVGKFDAFIFIFGETITNCRVELPLLRWLNKKIIFLYVGSDSRPPYINTPPTCFLRASNIASVNRLTKKIKRRLAWNDRYADFCIDSPGTGHFHSKPFINFLSVGIARILPLAAPLPERHDDGTRVRILHSPSKPEAKGTAEIKAAIDRLIAKGLKIDFVLLKGMPNKVVLEQLARCDFVVDQLYSDTPLAGFATEAANFGKPAVVGGYFSSVVKDYLRDDDIPPSLFVSPEQIESAIEKMVVDSEFRLRLGAKAHAYVASRWSSVAVATRYLKLLTGDVPDEWWCDPYKIRYVGGAATSEKCARAMTRAMVERYGVESLQLKDKPELEKAFLDFYEVVSGHSA